MDNAYVYYKVVLTAAQSQVCSANGDCVYIICYLNNLINKIKTTNISYFDILININIQHILLKYNSRKNCWGFPKRKNLAHCSSSCSSIGSLRLLISRYKAHFVYEALTLLTSCTLLSYVLANQDDLTRLEIADKIHNVFLSEVVFSNTIK